MSDASRVILCTVPPGNNVQTITMFPTGLPECTVTHCNITWPAGCVGLVGVALYAGGSPAFPNEPGQFFNYDYWTYPFDVSNQIDTGDWTIAAYNLDIYAHTVSVVLEFDYPVQASTAVASAPIAL